MSRSMTSKPYKRYTELVSVAKRARSRLVRRENPPHLPSPALGREEPKLLREPAESHTPQDFPSFATETNYLYPAP